MQTVASRSPTSNGKCDLFCIIGEASNASQSSFKITTQEAQREILSRANRKQSEWIERFLNTDEFSIEIPLSEWWRKRDFPPTPVRAHMENGKKAFSRVPTRSSSSPVCVTLREARSSQARVRAASNVAGLTGKLSLIRLETLFTSEEFQKLWKGRI